MLNRLLLKSTFRLLLPFVMMIVAVTPAASQCGLPQPLKAQRITFSEPIDPQTFFQGMLAWLPDDYGSTTTNYPVFIYFHGNGGVGNGSAEQLCNIFETSENLNSLPNRLERGDIPATIQPGGVGAATKYIVVAPQYDYYLYPDSFPSATAVEAVIDEVISRFRVRPNQIYLTGMSSGANMVMEYVGSSLARARRVAGAMVASVCSPVANTPNAGTNIGQAGLSVWLMHCQTDGLCPVQIPTDWNNQINAGESVNDATNPVFTVLGTGSNPACQGFAHDTWTRLYDPAYEVNGMNVYEWALTSTSTLPVTFASFDARILNGKTFLKWVTSNETGNAAFTIERSRDGRNFSAVGSVKGSGNSTTERIYDFVDNAPLGDVSFYRLLQSDDNGAKNYSVIRKVFNRTANSKQLIVSPNPITTELSAFIQVNKKQRVLITLTDMNGRRITQVNRMFEPGNTEFTLPTGTLNKGIYLLKVTGETISETQKVIRQ